MGISTVWGRGAKQCFSNLLLAPRCDVDMPLAEPGGQHSCHAHSLALSYLPSCRADTDINQELDKEEGGGDAGSQQPAAGRNPSATSGSKAGQGAGADSKQGKGQRKRKDGSGTGSQQTLEQALKRQAVKANRVSGKE